MSMLNPFKTILLLTYAGSLTLLSANVISHPFEVESGMVIYEISGGTQLTAETNLSISGNAKLRFKEWGDIRLKEEKGMVLTTGAIKHKQYVKKLEKHTKDTVITADYKNEQLLERKKSTGKNYLDETEGLIKKDQETVSGVVCDIWEGVGAGVVMVSPKRGLCFVCFQFIQNLNNCWSDSHHVFPVYFLLIPASSLSHHCEELGGCA